MTTQQCGNLLIEGLSSVIKGKAHILELISAVFLSGGHLLLDDLPGTGKTTLAKTLSSLVSTPEAQHHISFKRIQCTPDLLPYDITGVDVFNPKACTFEFIPGPVFTDILLADEINRSTPKVQSALLEVMAERQVTISGITREVSPLFFVVATQNPVETQGTYPLPAAQLDRFMARLSLGYPDMEAEQDILHTDPCLSILPHLKPVISSQDILDSRAEQQSVFCHPSLEKALLTIVRKTREHPSVSYGVSSRGALQFLHASRTLALLRGRTWIEDTDIYELAIPLCAHRIYLKDQHISPESFIKNITESVLSEMNKKTNWKRNPIADV